MDNKDNKGKRRERKGGVYNSCSDSSFVIIPNNSNKGYLKKVIADI
ncbi:MAG: hypothetical protein ACTSQE_12180 [Candidatus Heimdallarchaeaceae archaeon]